MSEHSNAVSSEVSASHIARPRRQDSDMMTESLKNSRVMDSKEQSVTYCGALLGRTD